MFTYCRNAKAKAFTQAQKQARPRAGRRELASAITSRIQSTSDIPGLPSGCRKWLNSRCVCALTKPGQQRDRA